MDFHTKLNELQRRLARTKAMLLQHQSRLDDSDGIVESILNTLQQLKQLMEDARVSNIAEVIEMIDAVIDLQVSLLREPGVLTEELAAQIIGDNTDDRFANAVDVIVKLTQRLSSRLSDMNQAIQQVHSLDAMLAALELRLERAQENGLAQMINWVDRRSSQLSELIEVALPAEVLDMMSELQQTREGEDVFGMLPASLHIFERLFDADESEFPDVFEKALYKVHGPRWRRMRFRDLPADDPLTYYRDVERGHDSRIRRGMCWIFLLMDVRASGTEWPDMFGSPRDVDSLIETTGFMLPGRRQIIVDALTSWDVMNRKGG